MAQSWPRRFNGTRAVEMSIFAVRAFVQLREMLASNKELARRFAQLGQKAYRPRRRHRRDPLRQPAHVPACSEARAYRLHCMSS
jgi:hypothetical protein